MKFKLFYCPQCGVIYAVMNGTGGITTDVPVSDLPEDATLRVTIRHCDHNPTATKIKYKKGLF